MLTYNVTLSSHIYLSNQPTEVNMWWEATMIWFNLLGHIKEVELTKNNQIEDPHILQNLQELPHFYRLPTLEETH